ncbi:MAG: hypothetical protein P1U56_05760 [Saprospiraceae bacterium]|nr:hypothetical protein [Saprospiraceae bacterium]
MLKTYYPFFICLFTLLIGLGCRDSEEFNVDFPAQVELGQSIVSLNGRPYAVETAFFHDTINEQLIFTFRQGDQSLVNDLGFSFLPVAEGNYIVHEERTLYLGAFASFRQTINFENDGWVYELIDPDDGYFNIHQLNTLNCQVAGDFSVQFKVAEKNGFGNADLPEKITFQSVFNEPYIKG